MTIQEFYKNVDGNYKNVLLRLPTEELVICFVKRFVTERSYGALMDAVERGDVQGSFEAAHALKGVAGNMAFTDLFRAAGELVEQLRPCKEPADPTLILRVKEDYRRVIAEIRRFEAEEDTHKTNKK